MSLDGNKHAIKFNLSFNLLNFIYILNNKSYKKPHLI